MIKHLHQIVTRLQRRYITSTNNRANVGVLVLHVCKQMLVKHQIDTHIVVKSNNLLLYFTYDVETLHSLLLLLTKEGVTISKIYTTHLIIRL